ncbi:helix-turn-helix domain-containing protein [Pseudochrobactrum sp. sp1633]|nr:helix-turn-helix domain-containing protein [Pseudochrobactrum sp. sp1633]MDM8345921.1 helix-turn-helix domain-containing protein [Pseudochrobactrum sp. sp1633]
MMQDISTLSIAQTARILGIGRSTLYNLIKDGQLPIRKLGKRTLILREDLDQFIASLPTKGGRG